MEPLRTPDEISAYLQVPKRTLQKWRYQRTGPTYQRVGGAVRYRKTDVDTWLAEHTKAA